MFRHSASLQMEPLPSRRSIETWANLLPLQRRHTHAIHESLEKVSEQFCEGPRPRVLGRQRDWNSALPFACSSRLENTARAWDGPCRRRALCVGSSPPDLRYLPFGRHYLGRLALTLRRSEKVGMVVHFRLSMGDRSVRGLRSPLTGVHNADTACSRTALLLPEVAMPRTGLTDCCPAWRRALQIHICRTVLLQRHDIHKTTIRTTDNAHNETVATMIASAIRELAHSNGSNRIAAAFFEKTVQVGDVALNKNVCELSTLFCAGARTLALAPDGLFSSPASQTGEANWQRTRFRLGRCFGYVNSHTPAMFDLISQPNRFCARRTTIPCSGWIHSLVRL